MLGNTDLLQSLPQTFSCDNYSNFYYYILEGMCIIAIITRELRSTPTVILTLTSWLGAHTLHESVFHAFLMKERKRIEELGTQKVRLAK